MSLLQIPREIRLQILHETICHTGDQPSCPAVSQEGRTSLFGSRNGIWQLPIHNPALPLLLVNKQIHVEIKDVLERIPADYHVDIMFVKSYGLWTIWTIPSPPRTQYINSIHATFRLFEPTEDLDPRFKHSLSFRQGSGGPPSAVWSFYELLNCVFTYGPGYPSRESLHQKGLAPPFAIKRIIINVSAPTDGASHKSIIWDDEKLSNMKLARREKGRVDNDVSVPTEQRLSSFMAIYLNMILNPSYHTMDYGSFLYENVLEDITFLVKGQEYKRYDMDQLMAQHRLRDWGTTPSCIEKRQQAYEKWLGWVHERRRRMRQGLELDNNRPVGRII